MVSTFRRCGISGLRSDDRSWRWCSVTIRDGGGPRFLRDRLHAQATAGGIETLSGEVAAGQRRVGAVIAVWSEPKPLKLNAVSTHGNLTSPLHQATCLAQQVCRTPASLCIHLYKPISCNDPADSPQPCPPVFCTAAIQPTSSSYHSTTLRPGFSPLGRISYGVRQEDDS